MVAEFDRKPNDIKQVKSVMDDMFVLDLFIVLSQGMVEPNPSTKTLG